jgi:hypothetical protein
MDGLHPYIIKQHPNPTYPTLRSEPYKTLRPYGRMERVIQSIVKLLQDPKCDGVSEGEREKVRSQLIDMMMTLKAVIASQKPVPPRPSSPCPCGCSDSSIPKGNSVVYDC